MKGLALNMSLVSKHHGLLIKTEKHQTVFITVTVLEAVWTLFIILL